MVMDNLRTTYMGIELHNPIIVASCSLSKRIDGVKELEDAGAAGLVIKSLFEEQIQIDADDFEGVRTRYDETFAEAVSLFPRLDHAGPKEHIFWVGRVRTAVKMPLFASLNCANSKTWPEYARQLQETGVDGLELNFYSPPIDADVRAGEIEKREIETLAAVRSAVKIPIAVKLHPYYTSLMNVVAGFQAAGANGLVLFNRLFQPDIDVETETKRAFADLSEPRDSLVALRWTALLANSVQVDIASSTGIQSGRDVAKMILAGAKAVQIASILYREDSSHIRKMLADLSSWMQEHQYASIDAFRGKLAKTRSSDAWSFERGQYIKAVVGID
jgi:dihydroorotate dehydrogenase (fumarate)